MRFPYTDVGSGIFRPLVPALIKGPAGFHWTDGLADSAADRTIIRLKLALRLGIDPDVLTPTVIVETASGNRVPCKLSQVIIELRRDFGRITWLAEVAVATLPTVVDCHWGFKGFLEYFRARFDGPGRFVTLTATATLPKTKLPRRPRAG